MKLHQQEIKIGDIKILKKDIDTLFCIIEKGDKVEVMGIGERGYDIKEVITGARAIECGFDIFE
ncbi:hypothetical protein Goe21_00480 [Bacillus phage vB_BsuM-Goe21]|nr:hypothetical protein Goe21_00480 [Bacillus phage vB_BsuM-Goe21]